MPRRPQTHVGVDGERGVLWTAHLAVPTQVVCAQSIAELTHLREQLGGVLAVNKDDVVDAALVEEGELMERAGGTQWWYAPRSA